MPFSREFMSEKRDKKVRSALTELAPIWLQSDDYRPREDSLLFTLVYDNPVNGWVSERYKYDAYNDVLYHMGVRNISEEEALKTQETDPYIGAEVATRVPNSPAQRLSLPLPKTPRK